MYLHNCWYFQEYIRILLLSLRAHCKAPTGPGSIRKYLEELVSATGVYGRFVCSFRTKVHFPDIYDNTKTSQAIVVIAIQRVRFGLYY